MEINALSEINQKYINRQVSNANNLGSNAVSNTVKYGTAKPTIEKDTFETQNDAKQPNNLKKILLAFGGIAVCAAVVFAFLKKGKSLSLENFKQMGVFEKGNAFFKGKPYTGKITIGDGEAQKVINYSKGKMVSSLVGDISKKYKYSETGKLSSVEIFSKADELVKKINFEENNLQVMCDKAKLNVLFNNQDKLTFEEFYDKAVNNTRYKSKADNEKIADILEYKDKIEYIAKNRTIDQARAIYNTRQAQELFEAPFRDKLAYGGPRKLRAAKSAKVFEEMFEKQNKYDASFEEKLAQKSAQESAKVFMENLG